MRLLLPIWHFKSAVLYNYRAGRRALAVWGLRNDNSAQPDGQLSCGSMWDGKEEGRGTKVAAITTHTLTTPASHALSARHRTASEKVCNNCSGYNRVSGQPKHCSRILPGEKESKNTSKLSQDDDAEKRKRIQNMGLTKRTRTNHVEPLQVTRVPYSSTCARAWAWVRAQPGIRGVKASCLFEQLPCQIHSFISYEGIMARPPGSLGDRSPTSIPEQVGSTIVVTYNLLEDERTLHPRSRESSPTPSGPPREIPKRKGFTSPTTAR
ncbi:hypothetical protein HOY80DRAFT_113675 [Tuber brumale]|nr:hypothetical protein HOY80DRAFT_113675 [Tuber brumale]